MKEISFMTLELFVPRIICTSVGRNSASVDQLTSGSAIPYLPFKIFARYKIICQLNVTEYEGEREGQAINNTSVTRGFFLKRAFKWFSPA